MHLLIYYDFTTIIITTKQRKKHWPLRTIKMVTEKNLKKVYQDLMNDKIHQNCSCPSCLYQFVKSRNKKIRIGKDYFFLYYLAHFYSYTKDERKSKFFSWNKDRIHEWDKILELYYKITGDEGRKIYFRKEGNRQVPENFRIISRYDKKFNLSGIINSRDVIKTMLPVNLSPFLMELENIFEIIRQRSIYTDFPPAYSLPPEILESAYFEFFKPLVKFALKIIEYLFDKSKTEDSCTQRELSRKYHAKRDALILPLSYLEFRKLIIWDKKNKKISLDPDYLFWLANRFYRDLCLIVDGIKEMAPYSIRDAKEIMNRRTEYTLKLYEQSKAKINNKILSKS